MNTFFQSHRKEINLVLNLLFWLVTCFFFVRYSVLRPICKTHIYKEFVCVGLIAAVMLVTRWVTIPKLFLIGRYGFFWIVSTCMLLAATGAEILLVNPDVQNMIFYSHVTSCYLPYYYGMIFFRDSCFFAWFLVLRLYTLQKETFKAKQRASVLEHQAVQFSTPDQKEISIPVDIIVYIQEIEHTTRVHCITDEVVTVTEPLFRCKEIIPDTLWTVEGSDKMVFHHHLSEYVQTQSRLEIREIKTVIMLNERQYRLFKAIRENPGCNATFLHESFHGKVSHRTIERDLSILRSRGVVAHTGSNKGGGYEVVNHNVVSVE